MQAAFETCPEEGALSYQLLEKPTVADPPPMKRQYRVGAASQGDSEDGEDGLSNIVSFSALPLSVPQARVLRPDEKEWHIDVSAS